MSIIVKERILAQASYVLEKAVALYPQLPDLRKVEIQTNLRGEKAGQARRDYGEYHARFNLDYAVVHLQHVLFEIIPHEIAHIVRFIEAEDSSHGLNWKKTCSLPPAKVRSQRNVRQAPRPAAREQSIQLP